MTRSNVSGGVLHLGAFARLPVFGYLAAMRAVIDIGSNSVLLLVGQRRANGSLDISRDESTVARLAEGAAASGRLRPEAIERALVVLRRYRETASAEGVDEITAVATEGL